MDGAAPAVEHDNYDDNYIRKILAETRSIAVIGASATWNRPSFFAMKYLKQKGYHVYPVNPGSAGSTILGQHVSHNLEEVPEKIDMVDVFRPSEECVTYAEQAIRVSAKVLWLQLGIRNDEAAALAEAAGLKVVMNRCPKIEYARLHGELSWNGINSRVISSKRRRI